MLRLAEQSTQPRVRAELTRLAAAIPESPAAPLQARVETATALVGGGGGACAPRAGGAAPVSYVEPRHAWEQSNEFVTLLVMDLPPFLTKEAKEQVTCRIAEDSVDLVVPPNIRLRLFPLEKLINAPESTFKVKRTQIEIALRKKSQFEHWGQLLSKKSAREVREEEKDPSLMIQNMMKTSCVPCARRPPLRPALCLQRLVGAKKAPPLPPPSNSHAPHPPLFPPSVQCTRRATQT